ncbi:hypothetical protein L218DRAFT_184339 [Marasmius fiardii PR-910]|nr:hypothetical protein L218DRAFT_184339 [Marasmius fiardii PR-910]
MDDIKTPFLNAVSCGLPDGLSEDFRSLCNTSSSDQLLDNIIRFISGGPCASQSPIDQQQWITKQSVVRSRLSELVSPHGIQKRTRDTDDLTDTQASGNKRQKNDFHEPLAADDQPVFTLKSVSVTSPVRKKVDITIHKSSIRFHNASTNALEHSASISSLRRGFLVPTRGKTKPHWTIILISSDVPSPEKGKGQTSAPANFQVIFGLDASATTAMTTTDHTTASPKETKIQKGEETLSLIREFLSHLPFQIFEPSTDVFKSAFSGAGGNPLPGVEAYRGAKGGSLWFMKEGILWGDAKPCEFWPVEELINKGEGLRVISATGRTLTVILTRAGEEEEDGEVVREESQFAPIDAKEQDAINQWVREHRHLFGKRAGGGGGTGIASSIESQNIDSKPTGAKDGGGPAKTFTLNQAQFESEDEEDADFEASSEEDAGSDSSSDGDGEGGDAEGEDEEEEEDAEGDDMEEEKELKPENHPLLRPGAMPKMSKAAMDMVVDMVEGDLARATGSGAPSDGEAEEDELDD